MENITVIEEKVILPGTPLCKQTVTIPCIKGDKGDKGDPLTYDDLTPEQIEELQRPAIEAAETANEAAKKADTATEKANTAAQSAITATTNANNATSEAITAASLANEATDNANSAALDATNAANRANEAIISIGTLETQIENKESKREVAETTREEAETQRAEAETSRRQKFSQMETTVNSLVEETTEAKNDATKAATNANAAADKANQAAESIAYKENGFYISRAFLEATDLRYIGFKEIENDKTCYLLTMGRCLKFSLDTYEVFWDIKLEGYGVSWHNAAEQLRVIEDKVYIVCTRYKDEKAGIWLIRLNEEDGAFISEELIPIPVQYAYATFKNKEVLITNDYIYGVDSVNKQILRCSMEDKSVEIIDSIDSAVSFPVLGDRWITLPDGSVKYALVWISAKNHIKIVDEDNNLYSIELAFSNNTQITTSQDTYIHNINFKTLYINLIKSSYRHPVHLTDGGDNSYSAENIGVRNSYQNFPYTTEFYGNSMTTPDTIVSTNILSVTNLGFYRPITNNAYIFMSNDQDMLLAANLSTSRTGVRRQIEIINPI